MITMTEHITLVVIIFTPKIVFLLFLLHVIFDIRHRNSLRVAHLQRRHFRRCFCRPWKETQKMGQTEPHPSETVAERTSLTCADTLTLGDLRVLTTHYSSLHTGVISAYGVPCAAQGSC